MVSTRKVMSETKSAESGAECGVRTGEKRVLIGETSLFSDGSAEIVSLPHPRTKAAAAFFISQDNRCIREVVTYSEDNRCWFLDECIESNGKMFFLCSFDPLLIILPYLQKSARLEPLENVLKDQDFPHLQRLADPKMLKHLHKMAERKGSADLNVWKYDECKTLEYLSNKTRRLSRAFVEQKINISGGAVSGNFVKSLNQDVDEDQYLAYAYGITCEYIDSDLCDKLRKHLKLPEEEPENNKKRANDPNVEQSANKKAKRQAGGPDEDYSKVYKKGPGVKDTPNAVQNALAKSASGTKSITSFFGKK